MLSTPRRKRHRSQLTLEALEERQLLDAGGSLPALAPLTPYGTLANFDSYFLNAALSDYGNLFGTTQIPTGVAEPFHDDILTVNFGGSPRQPFASPSSDPQVPGVEEGDLVQSDGAHLYVLFQNQLVIMDTSASGGLDIASRIDVPDNPVALFLDGTRLAIVSQVYVNFTAEPLVAGGSGTTNLNPRMEVSVYDVGNAAAPRQVQDTLFDGTFVTARSVGDHLYVVGTNSIGYLPAPQAVLNSDGTETYETEASYVARIEPQIPDLILPHYYQPGSSADSPLPTGLVSAPADVYQRRFPQDASVNSIFTFDMTATGDGVTDVQTFLSSNEEAVYATTDHLYFVSNHYSTGADDPAGSIIQRFDMDGDGLTPGPAGFVPGTVSGQYALDEFNGNLRVAATLSFMGSQNSTIIDVFEQDGSALDVIGSLQGIGAGDVLDSVRFAGNEAYLSGAFSSLIINGVQNSLFVVDLSDPTNPTLAGQVLSNGSNNYLQALDSGHLLGIGYDEKNAQSQVELTLYDVSDPRDPAVIDQIDVPGDGRSTTFSPAENDPNALAYSPAQNLLAIPVTETAAIPYADVSSQDLIYQIDLQFGFHLVSLATGFDSIGSVTHDSQVERSLFQGNLLYSIADNSVKVQSIIQNSPPDHPSTLSIGPSLEVRFSDDPRMVQYPTLRVSPNQPFAGSVLNFTVSDPTGLTATIDWGDGTSSTAAIVSVGNNVFSVEGQHSYGADGAYTITVTLLRDGQNAGTFSNSIQAGYVDPQIEYYLQRLYDRLLQRNIEQPALDYWAADLSQGLSRAFVAQSIMQSAEYRTIQIQSFYSQWLNRPADASGLATWLQYLAAGHSLDDVRLGIVSSQEFFTNAGSTANYVSELYIDLLGRQADPGGQLAWETALLLGLPREVAVTVIAHSHEAAVRGAILDFQAILGRPAESDGLLYFADAFQGGSTTESVAAAIYGSPEFFEK